MAFDYDYIRNLDESGKASVRDDIRAKIEQAQAKWDALTAERDQLRAALAAVTAERDELAAALRALLSAIEPYIDTWALDEMEAARAALAALKQ